MSDAEASVYANNVSTANIRLERTKIKKGLNGHHLVVFSKTVFKLYLANPACKKQNVRMKKRDAYTGTAQMWADKRGNFRIIKEFLENTDIVQTGDVGLENDEQATLEMMALTQIVDTIGRIETVEATLEQAKKSLKVEHKQEIEKLEEEHKRISEQHKINLNMALYRH